MSTDVKNGRNLVAGVTAVLVSLALVGVPAMAQDQDEAVISEQAERETLTDDLIGMPVYTPNTETDGREHIGDIQSLLLNENNRLTGVVVSIGGFLGFGAKSVALDWESLEIEQFGQSGFVANVELTREELEEAPAFKTLAQKRAEEEQRRAQEQMEQQQQQQGTGGGTGTTGGTATE